MQQSEIDIPGSSAEFSLGFGLWYDADRLVLEGAYLDEITAYRARKRWIQTLETNFLLEERHDFKVKVRVDPHEHRYQVKCVFLSACGRYAFWRLTHHQAPEVQFMLETAHLPSMTIAATYSSLPESDELLAQCVSSVSPEGPCETVPEKSWTRALVACLIEPLKAIAGRVSRKVHAGARGR